MTNAQPIPTLKEQIPDAKPRKRGDRPHTVVTNIAIEATRERDQLQLDVFQLTVKVNSYRFTSVILFVLLILVSGTKYFFK